MRKNDISNNILYLQNIEDTYHVRRHSKPLIAAMNIIRNNEWTSSSTKGIVFWSKYWGDGHIVPNDEIIINILERLINDDDPLKIALEL